MTVRVTRALLARLRAGQSVPTDTTRPVSYGALRPLALRPLALCGLAALGMVGCGTNRSVVLHESPVVPLVEHSVSMPGHRDKAVARKPSAKSSDQKAKAPKSDITLTSAEATGEVDETELPLNEEVGSEQENAEKESSEQESSSAVPKITEQAPDTPSLTEKSDETPSPVPDNVTGRPEAAYTLTLSAVLSIADAQNPNVGLARERINEAYARMDRAESLWLPSIRAGLNYNHHEGPVQSSGGAVNDVSKSSLYGGFGAGAVGAGTPNVPGLAAQFHVADAIFQPKIAGLHAASRQYAATAVRNNTLRDTAVAYLELVRAEQAVAITEEAQANTRSLLELTSAYSRTGQGLRSDDERVRAELVAREGDVIQQAEAIQTASARLAQLLHSNPSVMISSNEPVVAPLDMFPGERSDASLIAGGLSRRPELAEQRHLVCEACERLKREQYAPLVPSVLLGLSYGGFGGGTGGTIGHRNDRVDADALAFWEVRNLGFGERAARDEAGSVAKQARLRQVALLDQVAREVTEAHIQVQQRRRRIAVAQDGIVAAEKSLELNLNRIQNAQGLPIEALQSVQALANARMNYLNAVIDYNVAQFELCRATGWFMQSPATEPQQLSSLD